MNIKLFQIAPEKDSNHQMFMNYEFVMSRGGIHEDVYELVYEGEVEAENLEDVYFIFNRRLPKGYQGRSLSVSDVVWVDGKGCFFCDSFGFKQISFRTELCAWRNFNG